MDGHQTQPQRTGPPAPSSPCGKGFLRFVKESEKPPPLSLVPKLPRFLVTVPPGTESNALSGILGRLKNVTKPQGRLMFPYVRPAMDYEVLEQKLPALDKDFIYELVIDVWPIPDSWIIHGIWPGYIKGDWIVYYVPKDMDADSYRILKEATKKKIAISKRCRLDTDFITVSVTT